MLNAFDSISLSNNNGVRVFVYALFEDALNLFPFLVGEGDSQFSRLLFLRLYNYRLSNCWDDWLGRRGLLFGWGLDAHGEGFRSLLRLTHCCLLSMLLFGLFVEDRVDFFVDLLVGNRLWYPRRFVFVLLSLFFLKLLSKALFQEEQVLSLLLDLLLLGGWVFQQILDAPSQLYQLFEVGTLNFRVLLVKLQHLITLVLRQGQIPQIDQHGQATAIDELQIIRFVGIFVELEQNIVPQRKRIHQLELSGVYTSDPPKQEGAHLHIHEFDVPEQLQIHILEGDVAQLRDPLQNWGVDLGFRVASVLGLTLQAEHLLVP